MVPLQFVLRIKNLVAGRPGFIVPGLQSKHDDLTVADMLSRQSVY